MLFLNLNYHYQNKKPDRMLITEFLITEGQSESELQINVNIILVVMACGSLNLLGLFEKRNIFPVLIKSC